jgi:hypothetical protein
MTRSGYHRAPTHSNAVARRGGAMRRTVRAKGRDGAAGVVRWVGRQTAGTTRVTRSEERGEPCFPARSTVAGESRRAVVRRYQGDRAGGGSLPARSRASISRVAAS